MARSKFAFNAVAMLAVLLAVASMSGVAFAIDVAPTVSLSADSTMVADTVTLTAVAVDVLDNAGIQWIKIYENGGLLDTKSCGSATCTFVKVVTKATSGIFSYHAETQDNGGQTDTSDAVVVTFNTPPVLDPIGNQAVYENQLLQFTISATDPGDTLTYSASGLPAGASFDPATRTFSWTPDFTQAGVYPGVTFTVTDSYSSTDSEAITITVNNTNRNPMITSTPVTTGTENVAYSYDVDATDADLDTLTYALSTAPAGMTINSGSGLISWTPDYTQAGDHAVTVGVTDGIGGLAQQSFTISVANVNRAPTWVAVPVNQVINEDTSLSYDVDATDLDLDTILYSVNDTDFSIDANGVLTWTPVANWNGVRYIRLTASDGSLFVTADITVTVTGTPDPPVITSTAITSVNEDSAYTYDVDATDADLPYGDMLTFGLVTAPAGMMIDSGTGVISWTPNNSQVGTNPVNVSVTDGSAITAYQAFTVTVTNTNDPPVFSGTIASQTFNEDGSAVGAFDLDSYFTDDDLVWGDTLTYSVSGNSSVLVTINGNGTVDLSAVGNWSGNETLTFTATDSAGATASSNPVIVTVTALNDPPYLRSTIPDVSFDEDGYNDTIDLTAYFADVDNELAFSWSCNESNIAVAWAGTIVNITASTNWFGSGTLTFNATEKPGGEYSIWDSITVTVNPVPDYAVSIVSDLYYREVGLMQSAVYTITVSNTGDTADAYTLSVQNLDGADQAQLNMSSLALAAGATAQIMLTVSDSNPGVYGVIVSASGAANATTSTIRSNVTTADTGWVYSSTINGTTYTSQSTGIWSSINDSTIKNGSIVRASVGGNFSADISISNSTIDSTIVENSWLTSVNASASSINNSMLTNCVVINATVKSIVASDCYLRDGTYDPPGGGNNLTGSNITNSYTYQSNVTWSNVTDSNITYSNVNNSVIDNSTIEYSTVYDSTVRDSTLSWATVINGALITGSQLTNSTADNSTVTNSVLTQSNATDSTITDSVLTDTEVISSTLLNITATNSFISGTTISNVILVDANLTDGILYSGTITIPSQNATYNATGGLPLNLSNPSWPSVSLSYTPSSIDTNTAVQFTATISGQFDTSTTIKYEWDFDNNGAKDQTSFNASTAMKTYSASGSYVAKVTVIDGHGNSAYDTVALTVAYAPAPSGGGGSSWHEPQDTITSYLKNLLPGVTYTVAINLEDLAWTSIKFSVNESISDGEITVRRMLDDAPGELENIYQYIEASSTFADKMRDVEISYKISDSWLAENELDKTRTQLVRYNDDDKTWKYLQTTMTDESGGYTEFMSPTVGFSLFAITVPKLIPPQLQLPPEQPPEEPTDGSISIASMPGGVATAVSIDVDGLAVTMLEVVPSIRIADVKISVRVVSENTLVATVLPNAQQYFEITATSGGETLGDSGIDSVKIMFRLDAAMLKEQGLDISSVRLERWNNGCRQESRTPAAQQELCSSSWQHLPTTMLIEESGYAIYEAVSPGFSLFAITADAYVHPMLIYILAGAIVVVVAAFVIARFCQEKESSGATAVSRCARRI